MAVAVVMIYTGMPIYYNYKDKVVLANISFADISLMKKVGKEKENYWEIDYSASPNKLGSTYPDNYVPEYWLSKHLSKKVYAIYPTGVQTLVKVFNKLIKEFSIDTIVLVDGGVDSLMFGDEEDIGTFSEDMSTIVSASLLPITKILITNTWGVEGCISHNRYMENVAKLIRENGFLGAQFLEKDSEEGKFYLDVMQNCFIENSTINISLQSSILGQDWNSVPKALLKRDKDAVPNSTFSLQDWLGCPMGAIYWAFDLDKVASNIVYKDLLLNTVHINDVDHAVHKYRYNSGLINDDGIYTGKRLSKFF